MEEFRKELEILINRHNIENYIDVPDFLLAELICETIKTVSPTTKKILDWHGCNSVCHSAEGDSISPALDK